MYNDVYKNAKLSADKFVSVSTAQKNNILQELAKLLIDYKEDILAANALDMQKAKEGGRNSAFLDRLLLTETRIIGMAEGLQAVIRLADPVGEIADSYSLPNGLHVEKVRAPLGVIGIIFEARPNVAIDAAALCIKSGNGVILRGSRDSYHSVKYLVELIKKALTALQVDDGLVGLVDAPERSHTVEMLQQDKYIDVVIPRGGEALKQMVLKNATMPVIASAGGNCHIYIAPSADEKMVTDVVMNAKLSRPSTCNAVETLLFDKDTNAGIIKNVLSKLSASNVEIRGGTDVASLYPVKTMEEGEFYTEYSDLIVKVKVVSGINQAIAHINTYGTKHSEAILTNNDAEAEQFCKEVDAAAVYVNASTRFTDGFELGLGAEMGISTQKLHVRGPIGLTELTSTKYIVKGKGHIR